MTPLLCWTLRCSKLILSVGRSSTICPETRSGWARCGSWEVSTSWSACSGSRGCPWWTPRGTRQQPPRTWGWSSWWPPAGSSAGSRRTRTAPSRRGILCRGLFSRGVGLCSPSALPHPQICQRHGVYWLGRLLADPLSLGWTTGPLERLWLSSLRTLRIIFSLERNRKFFKSLLPPDLFFAFIDVGNYESDLGRYRPLLPPLAALGRDGGLALAQALEVMDGQLRVPQGRQLRGYQLLELLGKGAYGSVYRAKRLRGSGGLVAVKEVPLEEVGLAQSAEGLGQLCSEVTILSQLQHPNIVRYHESFVSNGFVYIGE